MTVGLLEQAEGIRVAATLGLDGDTQVNATDLRSMRYPDEAALRALGRCVDRLPGQDELDRLVVEGLWEKVAA